MKSIIHNQRGAVIVIFALSLLVLIGFVAIGTEAGRWYHVKAELAKAVDAAALAGAANISNQTIDIQKLAINFGMENFQPGYLGTATDEGRVVSFTVTKSDETAGKLTVTGSTTSVGILSRLFGVTFTYVPAGDVGVARRNRVQIMLVLDRSGSMAGTPLRNLKTAAKAFLEYYKDTQDEDKIGLVTFATSISLRPPDTNFFDPITRSIDAMAATGATNAEDALAQAASVFPDQRPVPRADRIQQFIIFFTDGRPTAFRSTFLKNNRTYDRVVMVTGNCDSTCGYGGCNMYDRMGYPDNETLDQTPPYSPLPTGDGLPASGSPRTLCRDHVNTYINTRWGSFSAYPVPELGTEAYPAYCSISTTRFNGRNGYICRTARQMAVDHAAEAKERLIKIYTIGLGSVDAGLLRCISSDNCEEKNNSYAYVTSSSSELERIFRRIASDIKLRLVQ
ncbi:vWA domain-containing protein [Syntrophorhabdus aromaticivorans]|uniref:VWA domain-containing protein n=1 Tax=Syntrophorhabdus aromaticivorans TaxID=328301 RepID=A0A971M5W6_9BACT|nr:vWA domain-containing protein [Syntrophorhabdus aromaticivorans]NLW36488.1 VWA domain-containing protein [Syntrophorhabdus aromaticivorans]